MFTPKTMFSPKIVFSSKTMSSAKPMFSLKHMFSPKNIFSLNKHGFTKKQIGANGENNQHIHKKRLSRSCFLPLVFFILQFLRFFLFYLVSQKHVFALKKMCSPKNKFSPKKQMGKSQQRYQKRLSR